MNKISLASVAVATTLAAATPVLAQQDDPAGDIAINDEIIVTAQKRDQTLQDVPISVSVTTARTIEQAQVRDLLDLQSLVPSLKVTQFQSAGQTNFIIRGFGNGNGNEGIESSVGVFIDGVYRSRSAAALDDLPEIERIEVLRGPQSTLFGKNVSAGAISIVTKKPQFTFGGKAEISLGNFGLINPRLTVTGPITDTLAIRMSGSVNTRDGHFQNVVTGHDVTNRNRGSVRADILFQPSSRFSVRIIGDYNRIDERCCGVTTVFNGPATLAIGALGFRIPDTSRVFDHNLVFNNDPTNLIIGKGVSGQIDAELGFAKFTSITAYRQQSNDATLDADFTGADIVNFVSDAVSKDFTQEFRLSSMHGGSINWLVGGFFQDEKLSNGRDVGYGRDARAYINALTGGTATSPSLVTALESLQAATNPAIIPGRTYFASGTGISDHYFTHQQSFSIFGQADVKLTDRLTLTGGVAYLYDRKAAASNVVLTDAFSRLNLENVAGLGVLPFAALPASISGCLLQKGYVPGARVPVNLFGSSLGASLPRAGSVPCPASPGGLNPFAVNNAQFFYGNDPNHAPLNFPNTNESGVLKSDQITYAARASYDLGPVNAYVSYATGWKAGAYNLSSDSRPPNSNGVGRTANPEDVTVYEFGLKAGFRGGYLNLAVFKQTIAGFQTNAFTGTGFNLLNAGKVSVKGFEVDASVRPMPWISLSGAVTFLDAKYDSFVGSACVDYDPVRCPINPLTGLRPNTRDLSGEKPAGVPTWSAMASAIVSHEFANGIAAHLRGEFDFASDAQTTEVVPPQYSTWGVGTLNASFAVVDRASQLEVMIWGRNLTNDVYLMQNFPTVVQTGSYSGYPNQPRTYGVTLRKSF